MEIGVLTARDENFHPNKRLLQEGERRGHSVTLMNPYRMTAGILSHRFCIEKVSGSGLPDVVLPRQGAAMGDYGLTVIRQLVHMGVTFVNGLDGVTLARNQYATLQVLSAKGIKVPDSCFLTDAGQFSKILDLLGGYPVIMKQVDGMGGDGVIKVDNMDTADAFMARYLPEKRGLVVQQFIPPQGRRDLRLFVIGRHVAAAMQLTPQPGNFRANIHQNSDCRAVVPDQHLEKVAVQAASACRLDVAGVDVIVPKGESPRVIEVNYSPGFKGIETATGLDIAGQVIDYAVLTATG